MGFQDEYIKGTGHTATLEARMNQFHKALTKRWREEIIQQVKRREPLTTWIIHSRPHYAEPDTGRYLDLEVKFHLDYNCAFDWWVRQGSNGSPGSVACDGRVGDHHANTRYSDPVRGVEAVIPEQITCPIGDLMAQVEDWAWGERHAIWHRLPKYDSHDVGALETAYRALERLHTVCHLDGYQDIDTESLDVTHLSKANDLAGTVAKLWSASIDGQGWLADWTGLAASAAKEGLLGSTGPTLINHSIIAACLANLVSQRAAIIEKGRNNAVYWIEQATAAIDEKSISTTDLVPGWKALQAFGQGVALFGAGSGPTAPAAAAVGGGMALIGFLGENLIGERKTWTFAAEMEAVVLDLRDRIEALNDNLAEGEQSYSRNVTGSYDAVNQVSSFDLELYDLTENAPDGTPRENGRRGFQSTPIDDILRLAEYCEAAGIGYEELFGLFSDVYAAEPHLSDKDGNPLAADTALVSLFDELNGFIRTTAARYLVAHDQILAAAEDYASNDEEIAHDFDTVLDDWGDEVGGHAPGFDVQEEAAATERHDEADDHPYAEGRGNDEVVYPTDRYDSGETGDR